VGHLGDVDDALAQIGRTDDGKRGKKDQAKREKGNPADDRTPAKRPVIGWCVRSPGVICCLTFVFRETIVRPWSLPLGSAYQPPGGQPLFCNSSYPASFAVSGRRVDFQPLSIVRAANAVAPRTRTHTHRGETSSSNHAFYQGTLGTAVYDSLHSA
jgi:hypothetical protein